MQQIVERLQRAFESFNRHDFDSALAMVRDDVTWERFLSRSEATTPVVHGKKELRSVWESQAEAVGIRAEPEEFVQVGDNMVVVPTRMVAHGSSSEISLTSFVTWVWTFDHDGLATKVQVFDSRAEALEAAEASGDP